MIRHWVVLFFLILETAVADVRPLRNRDVRQTLEEMFTFHVEFKELTPLIIKRSFKSYIELFDPEKIYLLRTEVIPFIEMPNEELELVIDKYYEDDFSVYAALNDQVVKSIYRAREWRQEIAKQLVLNPPSSPSPPEGEGYAHFAGTDDRLKERITRQLTRFLLLEKQISRHAVWDADRRTKVMALWERRLTRLEDTYLNQAKGEHYLALHILKSMARSLDAHTAYFSPDEAYEMRASLEKQFEGFGVVLREGVDGVVISSLVKGGPAEKSGKILAGDLLISIDGKSMATATYEEVLIGLKGQGRGETILGLKRFDENGEERYLDVSIRRERILMEDERLQYTTEPFAAGIIGKLVLPSFYESDESSSCEADIREAIKNLKRQGNLVGMVLDLRENSGGFLNQAVKVAGLFITNGVIIISKYARGEVKYLRDIDGRNYYDGPLIVLTSKASASAAEIVAQALQDYGAGLIVGDERTYGKGTIQYQTVTDHQAKAFFKVTVGKYYTVSGKSTQLEGVKADILVPTRYAPYHIGERFLEYPIPNDYLPAAYAESSINTNSWFLKNYLSTMQIKDSLWRKMLPILKVNSTLRLEKDPNFKNFVKAIKDVEEGKQISTVDTWGTEDLQMAEAVKILKDMIYLKTKSAHTEF